MLRNACSRPCSRCSKINDFPAQFLLTKHSVRPQASAAHSIGTLWRISLTKETQAGKGFLQCSSTVPVSELNLAAHDGRRHLGTQADVDPSLQGPSRPQDG